MPKLINWNLLILLIFDQLTKDKDKKEKINQNKKKLKSNNKKISLESSMDMLSLMEPSKK